MKPPNGLIEINALFGDVQSYVDDTGVLSPVWTRRYLTTITLPFPLNLAWDLNTTVTKMTCHELMAPVFGAVFAAAVAQGLQSKIVTFGGCFNFRQQRTGTKLSAHAWGIAVDLNPVSNAQGTAGAMDAGVVQLFKGFGFEWGGDWQGRVKDPMHFQFCTGY